MERRDKPRFARRLQVRFWQKGDPAARTGYTTNISELGMYVATSSPFPRATRVLLEILREDQGFMAEGVVAHAARVSPLLQRVRPSGMGVRFLHIADLVSELVPAGTAIVPETQSEASAGSAPAQHLPAEAASGGVYRLRFDSLPGFLRVLKQDIENGGLFVRTDSPAALEERIVIELLVPEPIGESLRVEATVVHRVEPQEGKDNLLAGMGVQFGDTDTVVRRINEVVYADPSAPTPAGDGA